jgi:hypothetical protein
MPANLVHLSTQRNSPPKCADRRQALASLGMAAPVSNDPKEAAAAALFSELVRASDYTHESLAGEVGVSAGRVSQWATNRGAVPWDKAEKVARLLGTEPELISPSWGELREHFTESLLVRLTPEIVGASEGAAKKLAGLSPGQRLDLVKHASFIADALRLTLATILRASEDSQGGSIQRNGTSSRLDRSASTGKNAGESPVKADKSRERASRGAKRA